MARLFDGWNGGGVMFDGSMAGMAAGLCSIVQWLDGWNGDGATERRSP